ncbi:lipase family protein [Rummeliibacillus sp. BSL5]
MKYKEQTKIEVKKINDYDNYALSDAAYNDRYFKKDTIISDPTNDSKWKVIEEISDKNGLQAFAVIPGTKGKDNKIHYNNDNIVIAFRGTEPFGFDGDVTADGYQVLLGVNMNLNKKTLDSIVQTQFKSALEFVQNVQTKYKPKSLTTTGHSLGGGLAQYTAAEMGLKATTFAGPNVYAILSPEAKKKVDLGLTQQKIKDYSHSTDPIGNFSHGDPWIGKKFYVKANKKVKTLTNTLLPGHPMETFESVFSSSGDIEFLVQPEDVLEAVKTFRSASEIISTIRKNLMEYLNEEEQQTRMIYNNMMSNVAGSGKYSLVSESAVKDYFDKKSISKEEGEYFFISFDQMMQLDQDLYNYQSKLNDFIEEVSNANQTTMELDESLAYAYGGGE